MTLLLGAPQSTGKQPMMARDGLTSICRTSARLNIFTGRVFEVLAIVLLHVRHCELIDVCGDIEVSPTILAQSIWLAGS